MAGLVVANKVRIKNAGSAQVLRKLFLDKQSADVYFKFDCGTRIPAHKLILISSSNVFATMFNNHWKEKDVVEIKSSLAINITANAFVEFMQFIYLDELEVTIGNVSEVMHLAKMYEMNFCLDACDEVLRQLMKLGYICTVLDLALTFDRNELKQRCLKFIGKNTTAVLSTEDFLSCTKNALKCVLESDDINCDELSIFNACMDWAKFKCKNNETDESSVSNLKQHLGECLHLIQFRLMSPQQVSNCVLNHKGLFNPEEMEDLFTIHSQNHSFKIFKGVDRKYSFQRSDDLLIQYWRVGTNCRQFWMTSLYSEKIYFTINKKMLLGALSTAYFYGTKYGNGLSGRLSVYETAYKLNETRSWVPPHKLRKTVFFEQIRFSSGYEFKSFDFSKINFTKFEKAIEVQPHKEYEIEIDFNNSIDYEYSFVTGELITADDCNFGIKNVATEKDNGLITCLYFIQCEK